jgi:hypothetical protein
MYTCGNKKLILSERRTNTMKVIKGLHAVPRSIEIEDELFSTIHIRQKTPVYVWQGPRPFLPVVKKKEYGRESIRKMVLAEEEG